MPDDEIITINQEVSTQSDNVLPDTGPTNEDEFHEQILTSSFMPNSDKQPLEYERLNNSVQQQVSNLDISPLPFNEFTTPCLATLMVVPHIKV